MIVTGFVDVQIVGEYQISLSVRDTFGRTTTEFLTIDVADLSPPTIHFFQGDSTISWPLGEPFVLPDNYVSATDNVDGDLSALLEITGLDLLDAEEESNQTIFFAVTDAAGNRVENQALTISFEQPFFTVAGVAIDGYLSGSSVEFIPADPNLNHLRITGNTGANGSFNLFFLEEDFFLIDLNGNQVIDPDEGTIIVSGGIDTTTNQLFTSALSADANSTIISPLSTILSEMIKSGTPKEQAQAELAASFGYSNTIDISSYDPIAGAKDGDSNTVAILEANALVVNTLIQITAVSEHMNSEADWIKISAQIAKSMADLVEEGISLTQELQKTEALEKIMENTFKVLDPSISFNSEQSECFSSVIQNTNQLLALNPKDNLSSRSS